MLFINEAQMKEAILPLLQKAVNYVIDEIFKENNKDVLDVVYGGYSPTFYDRTEEFAGAWTVDEGGYGGDVGGEFRYAPEYIGTGPAPYHASVVDGESSREYLADILYYGSRSMLFGHGGWTGKRNAFKVLDKWLTNSRFRQLFETGMSKAGIPWKRSTGGINVDRWSK